MKTYKSSSTILPLEWDKTSSPTTVYHNYNVTEIPAIDEENPRMYHYDVDEYTKLEYIEMQSEEIDTLKSQNDMLTQCILEMSALVYE